MTAAPLLVLLLHSAAAAQQQARMVLVARGGLGVPVLPLRSNLPGGDERRGVGSLFAAELEAWPVRNIGLRAGAEREASPIHYGGLQSGDASVLTVGGSLLLGRSRSDRHSRAYAALGGGMRVYRVTRPGQPGSYEHGSAALYAGGGGSRTWSGFELGLELGCWLASYQPQAVSNPGRSTQADGTLTVRIGIPLVGGRG